MQSLGLRSFTPQVSACPGCGRTTSTFFQEMAQQIQSYLREQMPVWAASYPGVEEMRVAVMGCVVNGPGESKHADIGISLPGTFEEPVAPVYVDGALRTTLRGEGLVKEFIGILDDYVAQRYGATADQWFSRARFVSDLRTYAFGLPEAHEDHPWGESVAKVGKKVFVFFGTEAADFGLGVKLPQSGPLALAQPGCTPRDYGLGKAGWVSVSVHAGRCPSRCCASGSTRATARWRPRNWSRSSERWATTASTSACQRFAYAPHCSVSESSNGARWLTTAGPQRLWEPAPRSTSSAGIGAALPKPS